MRKVFLGCEKAFRQLYTAVYNIRKTLGLYSEQFQISSISDGYKLVIKDTRIDLEQFEIFIDAGIPLSQKTIPDYEHALTIFNGEYLEPYDYIWAEGVRQRLQLKWIRTALQVAEWHYEHSEFHQALTLAHEICMRYPLEEDAHFLMMKVYDAIEEFSAVRHQYEKLEAVLLDELQVAPKPRITAWYIEWVERIGG